MQAWSQPAPTAEVVAVVSLLYAAIAVLHAVLPATTVVGYACDHRTGRPLVYRLNGLRGEPPWSQGWSPLACRPPPC